MRGLSNYLGIGIDARISYSVEKYRQGLKCINLMLYGCIGLCNFCKWIRPLHEAIDNFSQMEEGLYELGSESLVEKTAKALPLLHDKGSFFLIQMANKFT